MKSFWIAIAILALALLLPNGASARGHAFGSCAGNFNGKYGAAANPFTGTGKPVRRAGWRVTHPAGGRLRGC